VSRTRALYAPRFIGRDVARLNIHYVRPVGPVLILNQERYGRPQRQSVTHAAQDFRAILLYLHASAAPVSPLPARQFPVDLLYIDGQTCGHTFNYRHKRAPVRFSRSSETKHNRRW
jgi:hypothetical protein